MISAVSDVKATDKVRIINIKSDSVELYTIFSAHPTLKTENSKVHTTMRLIRLTVS